MMNEIFIYLIEFSELNRPQEYIILNYPSGQRASQFTSCVTMPLALGIPKLS